jgi:hypothetical protein
LNQLRVPLPDGHGNILGNDVYVLTNKDHRFPPSTFKIRGTPVPCRPRVAFVSSPRSRVLEGGALLKGTTLRAIMQPAPFGLENLGPVSDLAMQEGIASFVVFVAVPISPLTL